jgi:hypothetical protein
MTASTATRHPLRREDPDQFGRLLRRLALTPPGAPWGQTVPISFAELSDAVNTYLPPSAPGVAVRGIRVTDDHVAYAMVDRALGNLGTIDVVRHTPSSSELRITAPPLPAMRDCTRAELRVVTDQCDIAWRQRAIENLNDTRYTELMAQYPSLREAQAGIMKRFFATYYFNHLTARLRDRFPDSLGHDDIQGLVQYVMVTADMHPAPVAEDPTNLRIFHLVTQDPDITDLEIAQQLNRSRQSVNGRRRLLRALGYRVRS